MNSKKISIIYILFISVILVLTGAAVNCGKSGGDSHDHGEGGHSHEGEEPAIKEGHNHKHIAVEPALIKKWGIEYGSPETRDYIETVSMTGVVKQNTETTYVVNALVSGTVTALRKDVGDTVKKGDILCVLNSPELLEMKTRYIKAYQEYKQHKENYDRAKNLYKIKALEKKQMTGRETEYKVAQAEFLSLEAELNTIGYNEAALKKFKSALKNDDVKQIKNFLSPYYNILSPGVGKVMMRDLNLGARLENDKTIFEISDTRKLWAMMDAMEKDLQYLDKDKPVIVESDVFPGELFNGTVLAMMEKIDPELRTVKVRIEVENPDGRIKPEMYIRGKVETRVKKQYLAIPVSALVKLTGVDGVIAIHEGEFAFQAVNIIARDSAGYAFVEGLDAEDLVVIKGAFYLKAEYEIQSGKGDAHAGHGHAH